MYYPTATLKQPASKQTSKNNTHSQCVFRNVGTLGSSVRSTDRLTNDIIICLQRAIGRTSRESLQQITENANHKEIICRYFARNGKDFFPIKITNEINNNIEKYGITGEIGCIVTDGFCFTQSKLEGTLGENRVDDKIDAILLIYATFISKNEMGKNQYEAIKAGEETALSHLKDFYEKYKNRDFELEK